jgi:hypothetical protein
MDSRWETQCRGCIVLILLLLAPTAFGACAGQRNFPTPEAGARELVDAVQRNDTAALRAILGPRASTVINSGDAVVDAQRRAAFLQAYVDGSRLERAGDREAVLVIGHNEWPMPIPLVNLSTGWQFDTPQGIEEILTRRIGRNELAAMQVCLALVAAAQEYAVRDPERNGMPEYPAKLVSTPGRQDGLYWPTTPDELPSPIGPLLAAATSDDAVDAATRPPTPYHGYLYRILMRQGDDAPGGARDYVVKGHMIGGFAVLAYPADYGVSGIMSFIANQDGMVYEQNLGKETLAIASTFTIFNPDGRWGRVPVPDRDP